VTLAEDLCDITVEDLKGILTKSITRVQFTSDSMRHLSLIDTNSSRVVRLWLSD
jgi:hypothetical protein